MFKPNHDGEILLDFLSLLYKKIVKISVPFLCILSEIELHAECHQWKSKINFKNIYEVIRLLALSKTTVFSLLIFGNVFK